MRPIYHFTPKRIKAHVLICYLAFAVIRYTHQRIKAHNHDMSIENIRDALAGVESSIVEDRSTRKHYVLPSQLCKEAKILYEAMGIVKETHPRRMVS
jgi:transposase